MGFQGFGLGFRASRILRVKGFKGLGFRVFQGLGLRVFRVEGFQGSSLGLCFGF